MQGLVIDAACPDDDISLALIKQRAADRGVSFETHKIVRIKGCWCLVERNTE